MSTGSAPNGFWQSIFGNLGQIDPATYFGMASKFFNNDPLGASGDLFADLRAAKEDKKDVDRQGEMLRALNSLSMPLQGKGLLGGDQIPLPQSAMPQVQLPDAAPQQPPMIPMPQMATMNPAFNAPQPMPGLMRAPQMPGAMALPRFPRGY